MHSQDQVAAERPLHLTRFTVPEALTPMHQTGVIMAFSAVCEDAAEDHVAGLMLDAPHVVTFASLRLADTYFNQDDDLVRIACDLVAHLDDLLLLRECGRIISACVRGYDEDLLWLASAHRIAANVFASSESPRLWKELATALTQPTFVQARPVLTPTLLRELLNAQTILGLAH